MPNSFIANVNLLSGYVEEMRNLNDSLDSEKIATLLELSRINVQALAEDLSKDTYLGNKKISINLLENYKDYDSEMLPKDLELLYRDPANQVRYDKMEVLLNDFTIKTLYFNQSGILSYVLTNEELFTQLTSLLVVEHGILGTNIVLVPSDITDYEVLVTDQDTNYSNILKITLYAVTDDPYKEPTIAFAWADYTSALQLAATHLQELLYIANNLDRLLEIPEETLQLLTQAQEVLDAIQNIYLYTVTTEQYIRTTVTTIENTIVELDEKIVELEDDILTITDLSAQAQNAALSAITSANEAKTSEEASKVSEVNSKNSEVVVKASEVSVLDALAQIEILDTEIEGYANTASDAASAATGFASAAEGSATSAASASAVAVTKASEAQVSATSASNKATEASQFATNAANSANAASTSEDNAKISETNSKTSETNAKESENKAKQYRDETEAMTSAGVSPATYSKLGGVIPNTEDFTIDAVGNLRTKQSVIPSATTSVSGIVALSDSVTSSVNEGVAASPKAVKTAYDKGSEALVNSNTVQDNLDSFSTLTNQSIQNLSESRMTLAQVQAEISKIIDGSPAALDTLNELAAALGDDPNFAATITNQLTAINQSIGVAQSTANAANTTANNALPKAGGTMTGELVVPSINLDSVQINIVQDGSRKKMTFTF